MSKDRSKLFPRMTKTELMLLQTIQKGARQNGNYFIDIRKYDEPTNPKRDRRLRYERKRRYLEERGIKIYEKLK